MATIISSSIIESVIFEMITPMECRSVRFLVWLLTLSSQISFVLSLLKPCILVIHSGLPCFQYIQNFHCSFPGGFSHLISSSQEFFSVAYFLFIQLSHFYYKLLMIIIIAIYLFIYLFPKCVMHALMSFSLYNICIW